MLSVSTKRFYNAQEDKQFNVFKSIGLINLEDDKMNPINQTEY